MKAAYPVQLKLFGCDRAAADTPKTTASPAMKMAACITFRHVSCALQRLGHCGAVSLTKKGQENASHKFSAKPRTSGR